MAKPTREVTVYWDFENCTVPRDGSWATVCEGLRRLAQRFGEVVTIVAYLSSWDGELPRPDKLQWQALRKYGVEIKCVKRSGQKEDADRAIITDMILSMDDTPCNKTAMVISGDRDFTLPMSACAAKGMSVVLIADEGALRRLSYLSQAVQTFTWPVDVVAAAQKAAGPAVVPLQYYQFTPVFYSFD